MMINQDRLKAGRRNIMLYNSN